MNATTVDQMDRQFWESGDESGARRTFARMWVRRLKVRKVAKKVGVVMGAHLWL